MKFILIFGPPAVGKMSVGRELAKITGFRLFHNHMTIELVAPFFDFGTKPFNRLVTLYRREMLKEVSKSKLPGVIFTFVWALDLKADTKYIDALLIPFKNAKIPVYYVELEANLTERIRRNRTEERLEHKPTKRNLKRSEKFLLEHEKKYRFNTKPGEFTRKNYLKIDNTKLSAKIVATMIKQNFKF